MFNIAVAVLAVVLFAIPVLWVKPKRSRVVVLLVALAGGAVGYGLSKVYFYPEYLGWQFERELKKQPLFTLISQKYPIEFQHYIQVVRKNLRDNGNLNVVAASSAELVNSIFYRSLATAPDDYVTLYLKSTLELYHYLNGQDPKAVIKLENGSPEIEFDLSNLYDNKDFQNRLNHLLDTKRYVIEASIKTPVAPPSANVAEPLFKTVMSDLGQKYGDDNVRLAFTNPKAIAPNLGAQIIIGFYTGVLSQGAENAGTIMRFIASLKDVKPQENEGQDNVEKQG